MPEITKLQALAWCSRALLEVISKPMITTFENIQRNIKPSLMSLNVSLMSNISSFQSQQNNITPYKGIQKQFIGFSWEISDMIIKIKNHLIILLTIAIFARCQISQILLISVNLLLMIDLAELSIKFYIKVIKKQVIEFL